MIFTLAVLGSFVLYLVIGIVVGRKVESKSDYYVAGRSAPTFLIVGTLVASFMSTVTFLGEFGYAFDGFGVVTLVLVTLNVSGYVIGVLLFGRYLRRSKVLTVPEFFGKRTNSRRVRSVAGIMVIVGIGLYLVSVTQGLALVLGTLLGWPSWVCVTVVWAGYTIFTFLSGSQGVMINDTIMFLIFTIVGIVGMIVVFVKAGGPMAAMEKMIGLVDKPGGLTWHGATGVEGSFATGADALMYSLTLGVVWLAVVAVSPWQSSRYLMARNEHVAIRSAYIATATIAALYIFLMFGGFAVNLFEPDLDNSELAFIWAAENLMPAFLGVIAVTGVVAAGLSSASTFLSLIGFSAANDVFTRSKPDSSAEADGLDEKRALRTSQRVMLIAGVVVLVVTLWAPAGVLTIGYFAATLFAAAWGPMAVWCIHGKRLTARGAVAGMVAGFLGVGILNSVKDFGGVDLPAWANPVIIGFILSIAATLIGNATSRPSAAGERFRQSILTVPASDRSVVELRKTRRVVGLSTGVFVMLLAILIVFYVVPMSGA